MAARKQFYSADEAIALLSISKGTLYSYVSRGLVRSEETGGKTRSRRYRADDVDALVERKQQRRNPERVAQSALNWGSPVLESALTMIADDRLYYRGYDAAELAVTRTFEQVAALLWGRDFNEGQSFDSDGAPDNDGALEKLWGHAATSIRVDELAKTLKPLEIFQVILPVIGAADLTAYSLTPQTVHRTAQIIIQIMARTISDTERSGRLMTGQTSISHALMETWAPQNRDIPRLLDAMLILCADHELNVSSFTVRCVASAGSSPYAAVIAGLSALQGYRHGGASELVEILLHEAKPNPQATIASRLKRGESIPGFGHPLYTNADPRCTVLLALADGYSQSATDEVRGMYNAAVEIMELVTNHVGLIPNLDFGLATLCTVLGLPQGAPLTLFALGRTAGWIGHYLEQIETGQLIRPRATYVGRRGED